jgi:energy-coupling factor transporter ATP-binding protein EcfA2
MQGNYSWGLTEDLFDANLQLKDFDFTVRKGEFVCVIGDVGAGKSSILNALNGDMIYVPTSVVNEFNGKTTS